MPNQDNKQSNKRDQRNEGRGFAGMSDQKQREIASKGGKASHSGGRDSNS